MESLRAKRERAMAVYGIMRETYPEVRCSLDHYDPLQLLIATILAAQCTDERVNKVTPALFRRYPDAPAFAAADEAELSALIHSCGFFQTKARNIRRACAKITEWHGGRVPGTMDELLELDGVGRKTANVILGECFGVQGVVVDTHCGRLARRLGFTRAEDPAKVERDLMKVWPPDSWTLFSHCLVFHGRAVCMARSPRCSACPVRELCPFPDSREGRKIAK
jgi:endonuclease III